MDVLTAFWHLLNFLGPAVGVSLIAGTVAKLLWHRRLQSVTWFSLWWPAFFAASAVSVGGLVIFGRDGKMLTYMALVLAVASVLWWSGRR